MTAFLPDGSNEDALRSTLAARGVHTTGLRQYYGRSPSRSGLVIGFGRIATADIGTALQVLSRTLPRQSLTE